MNIMVIGILDASGAVKRITEINKFKLPGKIQAVDRC
jgi:hypothetical protein